MHQQQLQTNDKESSPLPLLTVAEPPQARGETMDMEALAKVAERENAERENFVKQEEVSEEFSLTVLLQKEARARTRETQMSFAWSGAFVAIMLLVAKISVDKPPVQVGMFLSVMIGMGLLLSVGLFKRSYRRKRALSGALAKAQDISHIGSLIEATRVENTPVRNLAIHSLIRLLPTMQATDAPLLTEVHRTRLVRYLTISPTDPGYRDLTELFSRSARQREIDLRLAILKALEQVGGAKELPAVERLARGLPNLQSASKVPKEVKDAASECLPYLQSRASEQRASEQLLRASSAHDTPSDILLRPAESHADSAPEQLLRASEI